MPRWSLLLGTFLLACGGEGASDASAPEARDVAEAEAWTPPEPEPWPEGAAFEVKGEIAAALPDLAAGRWVSHVTADDRPGPGGLAAFGVGNGRVFGLLGYPKKGPLNTLHGLTGPTYERGERFFGDYAIELTDEDGAVLPFDEEWVARDATGAVVLTRGRWGDVELETIDLAPPPGHEHANCLVRLVTARAGAAPATVGFRVRAASPQAQAEGVLTEASSERALTTAVYEATLSEGNALVVPAGEIVGEVSEAVTHCTAEGTTPPAAWRPDEAEVLQLIRQALEREQQARSDGTRLTIDPQDPRVAGFLDGMRATLAAQTAVTGAVCPMSQYTRTWARDNIGPMLYLLDVGDFEGAGRLLDYVWGATLIKGDLQNSYDADYDLSTLPAEPDWTALDPLAVRVGAETPSYLVILYGLWYRATGDLERARERWGLLRRSMLDVRFDEDLLLPWTGDETFRAAMNVSFGLGLDAPHHETSFSLNSNILWLAAARQFVDLAEALGEHDDAATVEGLAAEMEAKAMPRYLLADGCYSALIDRATGTTWPAPFEDASLTPTWSGWLDGDDPRAVANVTCLLDRIGVAPGVVQSPLDPKYVNFPLLPSEHGVFTGMKPGYTLAALTDVGHPDAEAAFNELRRSLDAGGNADEYLLFSSEPGVPYPGLTLFYNEQGLEPSDYTAKFRPWEGGIVADAAFRYLIGWRPDVPGRHVALRPHLPNGWSSARYSGLRAGDARFRLDLVRLDAATVRVTLAPVSGTLAEWGASLRWDAGGPVVVEDAAGDELQAANEVHRFGRVSTTLPTATVGAGLTWTIGE